MARFDWLRGGIWKLFNGIRTGRDSAGRAVIELRVPLGVNLGIAVIAPLLLMIGYTVNFWKEPMRVLIAVAFLAFAMALGVTFVRSLTSRSRLKITFDHAKSTLVVDSHGIHADLPFRDLANAEYATEYSSESHSDLYRLEFVLRNGERLPATQYFFDYFVFEDRELFLNTINGEIKVRGAMLE